MKSSRGFVVILALAIVVLLIGILPRSGLAAPQTAFETPSYLPLVLKNYPQTPITSTVPITVAPIVGGIEQFVFSPISVTVHVGDDVRWTWGSTGHTVTSGTAPNADNQFCSPNNLNCGIPMTSSQGATFDHVFLAPGTYPFFCQIHWSFGMTGTVVVVP